MSPSLHGLVITTNSPTRPNEHAMQPMKPRMNTDPLSGEGELSGQFLWGMIRLLPPISYREGAPGVSAVRGGL